MWDRVGRRHPVSRLHGWDYLGGTLLGVTRLLRLYPLLFAVHPVLALLAVNLGEIPASDAYRSLAIVTAASVVLLAGMALVARSLDKGAMLSAAYIVLFFTYGHVYSCVEGVQLGPLLVGRHRFLLGAWVVMRLAWTVWLLRAKRIPSRVKVAMQVVALTLVVFPLVPITRYEIPSGDQAGSSVPMPTPEAPLPGAGEYPDVFYIIPDAFGRSDVPKTLYRVDDTALLGYLESQGFYLATQSTSNYSQTVL